ncbi:MAG TPA: pentapeptide repeat-containing protein, partial [Arthrobacter sp.]|nr:pentapeptide repeat-containing protein [Arthrobacter sp.]
ADVATLHLQVGEALRRVSEEVRAGYIDDAPQAAQLAPGSDLAGARLAGVALCGADLRGACLIAADLRGADLTAVDLLGADLRDARLDGADLSRALFLTQAQVAAARGSAATRLPAGLARPGHWVP